MDTTKLTDTQAREIAADWCGGARSALGALATSGATVADARELEADPDDPDRDPMDGIVWEIESNMCAEQPGEREKLSALLAYVREAGPRGRQRGWSDLRF